jgi:choline dehydrogenase-like flavoprotein
MNDCDAVIVGSGAGGSVMAHALAERGLRVVVLEKGGREDPVSFTHDEADMIPRVYKLGGLQTTTDNDVSIVQGCTVGGSTVINNAIWIRADLPRILGDWKARGADLDRARIEESYAYLESVLRVAPVDPPNLGTGRFLEGCRREGVAASLLANNRETCIGCGWCNFGCRYNRKTSMLVTFIPWAEARGAIVLDRCADVRLVPDQGRVRAVEFVRKGKKQSLRADRFVASAGAIGSSELLLRSGITQRGHVGRRFHVLGGAIVNAEVPERVDGFDRIGLTAKVDDDRPYVVETFYAPPAAFSLTLNGWFEEHAGRMRRYAHMLEAGVMVGTEPDGAVTVGLDGRTKIALRFSPVDLARLTAGIKLLARVFLAAGATAVLPSTFRSLAIRRREDVGLLDEVIRQPEDLMLGSAHPQGGNPICEDPFRGVIGPDFRVHGMDNLFVADASVFPSNIWVNCQATVMALAHYASAFVAA